MATDAELEYLRRQNARMKLNSALGYQPVNQGQSSEAEQTPWLSFTQEQKQEPKEEPKNWLEEASGKVEDFMYHGTKGVFGFFEGLGDLVLGAVSNFGDWTGWYDTQGIKDFTAQDISGELTSTLKTMGFMPGQAIKNIASGNYTNPEFWQKAGNAFTAAFDTTRDSYEEFGKDYDLSGKIETGGGQFAAGVFESIGRMLPSIAVGNLGAEYGLTEKGAKALSVMTMGLSAGGSATAEALGEGVSSDRALAYGLTSGLIEVGTEYMIPGSKFAGTSFTTKGAVKATFGNLFKEMVEEGLEEVASDMLNPLKNWVKNGKDVDDLVKEFQTSYSDSEFWKDTGMSFLSGAVSGGIMSGGQIVADVKKAGGFAKYNATVRENLTVQAMSDVYDNWSKGKISDGKAFARLEEIKSERARIIQDSLDKFGDSFYNIEQGTQEDYDNYKKTLEQTADPKSYSEFLQEFRNEQIQDMINQFGTTGKAILSSIMTQEFQEQSGQNVYVAIGEEADFESNDQAYHIRVNENSGVVEAIVINPKYSQQIAGLLGHEGLMHALLDKNTAIRDELAKTFEKIDPKGFHALDEWITTKATKLKSWGRSTMRFPL